MRSTSVRVVLAIAVCGLLLPATARAQAGIAGSVIDETGGLLPGVTVEAASPALIEQVRTGITDGAGLYSIVDLRPGTYTVTFTLPGFSVVLREGIELSGSFIANVDAELAVGNVQETVTVTGASPVVDVQSTQDQQVLTKERFRALPGSRSIKGRAALIPGVIVPAANTGAVAHGSSNADSHVMIDGYKTGQHLVGNGTGQSGVGTTATPMEATTEELVYDLGGQGAEFALSGVRLNMIPKEGGNQFSGEIISYGSRSYFESDNRSQELLDLGFAFAPTAWQWDMNPAVGGPLIEDKLWWFGAFGASDSKRFVLDTFFNPDEPSTPEGEGGDLAYRGKSVRWSETVRITHQLNPKHKLRYSFDNSFYDTPRGNFGRGTAPEAAWKLAIHPTYLAQVKWTAALTSRWLVETGFSYQRQDWRIEDQPENSPTQIAWRDLALGTITRGGFVSYNYNSYHRELKAAVSYVTGSHNVKFGIEYRNITVNQHNPYKNDVRFLRVINGVPNAVEVTNGPAFNTQKVNFDGGLFVQDSWTLDRLTLNLGARYDRFNVGIPANSQDAGVFVAAITVPEIPNTPNWNDFNARLGVAYDLFGDGQTAIKATAGRYVGGYGLNMTSRFNPLSNQRDRRSWTDLNGDETVLNSDGTPQFDEIGPSGNVNFGLLRGTDALDPDLPRGKNWNYSLSLDHELRPGMSITGSYFRRRFFDINWTDNLAVSPSDYTSFTIFAPIDPNLPGGGGEEITLYNLNPEKFGQTDNLVTLSDNYRIYNGFEVALDTNLPRDGFLMTSWTVAKTELNNCTEGLRDDPNSLRFCNTTSPFRHIYKLTGGVPLPFDMMASANFQVYDTPGSGLGLNVPYISANYSVNSAIAGVPLTGGRSLTVDLVEPNTMFINYYKILDVRLQKRFTMGGGLRVIALAEFNNLFNWAGTRLVTESFGSRWLRPTSIQRGRNIRFGTQINF